MEGREREGPKLLLNQAPSEPCKATEAGSQSFEIESRDTGHVHLGVVIRFARKMKMNSSASSMSVPNSKQIAQFVEKLLLSQNFEIVSRDSKPSPI